MVQKELRYNRKKLQNNPEKMGLKLKKLTINYQLIIYLSGSGSGGRVVGRAPEAGVLPALARRQVSVQVYCLGLVVPIYLV